MPSITITVSTEAHERLSNLKRPGQSFSDVILEHVYPPPYQTAGELLDSFSEEPTAPADPELMRKVREGRGRASTRVARIKP